MANRDESPAVDSPSDLMPGAVGAAMDPVERLARALCLKRGFPPDELFYTGLPHNEYRGDYLGWAPARHCTPPIRTWECFAGQARAALEWVGDAGKS